MENKIKELEEKLLRKEQECERLKRDYFKQNEWLQEQKKELDQLKAENEELKTAKEILKEKFEIAIKNNMDKTLLRLKNGDVQEELQEIREQFGIETLYFHDDNTRVHRCLDVLRLKNVLTEIKPILEFYAISKVGEEQPDGTYKVMLSSGYVMVYDPKPAKQGLQKISEVEDEN